MKYLEALLAGIGTGTVLSLMLGTVFFAIIHYSITLGYQKGLSIAIGVILSDTIFIGICLFGSQYIPFIQKHEQTVKWIGGILVILLGIFQIINRKKPHSVANFSKAGSIAYFIGNGFLLNFLNPVNLVSWFAIYTYLVSVLHYSTGMITWYFSGSLIAIFGMEALLAFFAQRMMKFLPEQRLQQLSLWVGILFIILGIVLIVR